MAGRCSNVSSVAVQKGKHQDLPAFPPPSAIQVSSQLLASGVHSTQLRMLSSLQVSPALLLGQCGRWPSPSTSQTTTGSESTVCSAPSFVPGVCVCSMTWPGPASVSGLLLNIFCHQGGSSWESCDFSGDQRSPGLSILTIWDLDWWGFSFAP